MFKKIPGSNEYRINIHGKIKDIYGNDVQLERVHGYIVRLKLFGKDKEIDLRKLMLLAWYEVGYIQNLEEHFEKILFYPIDSTTLRISCKHIMVFSEPIEYSPGFRVIPCFPRYAINIKNEILDTKTNKIIADRRLDDNTRGYEHVYIYNPDKNGGRDTNVHRLVALAWLPNNDFTNRPYINHIDGVRDNNELTNLEWCSLSENAIHALELGLNDSQVAMKTRDSYTGEVVVHKSVTELGKYLGVRITGANKFDNTMPGYKFKGRYEVKRLDDESPWYYENPNVVKEGGGKLMYTITVYDKNIGKKLIYGDVGVFYKTYGVKPTKGGLEESMKIFKSKYPHMDVSFKRHALTGPYRVLNLEDNKEILIKSIAEVADITGCNRNMIQYDLSRGLKFIYNNKWIIVSKSTELNISEYVHKPSKSTAVKIINTLTGDTTEVDSIHEAERRTGITRRTIIKYLTTGKTIKGIKFRPL